MPDVYKPIILNLFLSSVVLIGAILLKILTKKKLNLFILLIIISILPVVSIARTGTYEAGDLTLHSVFLQSFYENLQDGILVPQWAGGLCNGFGCPVFLFEYITPFYIGSFFHLLGFSYIGSMKLFLVFSYILSGITMYAFMRDEYEDAPAFIGSLLYLFAPIHLMEMHFRVSVGTHAAFIFIPLAFLLAKKTLSGKPIYILLNAVNFLLLLLSHSSIAFVIIPMSCLYAFLKCDSWKQLFYLASSYVLGSGLSAYYVFPAVVELPYTWYSQDIKNSKDFKPLFDYLFSPSRFGLLFQGTHGELRLIVGYVQLFIIAYGLYVLSKRRFQKDRSLILFLLISFFMSFILMQKFTKPLWDNFFFLQSFILPWRLLVPIAFITSFLGAILIRYQSKPVFVFFSILIIFLTILNWGNRKMVPIDTQAYFKHWSLYTEYFEPGNALYEQRYKERVVMIPNLVLEKRLPHLEVVSGSAKIKELARSQTHHIYLLSTSKQITLSENTYYFPGWKVWVNGKEVRFTIEDERKFGSLVFSLPKGIYLLEVTFQDTPIRFLGKVITIFSIFFCLVIISLLLFRNYLQKIKNRLIFSKE